MIEQLAMTITSFLVEDEVIEKCDIDIYIYGIRNIILNTMLMLILSIIAIILNSFFEFLFVMFGFIPMRMLAGGYHAKKPMNCVYLTICVIIVSLLFVKSIVFFELSFMYYVLIIANILIVFQYAPLDNVNRRINKWEKGKRRTMCRLAVIFLVVLNHLILVLGNEITYQVISLLVGIFVASLSLMVKKHKGEKVHEKV